MPSNLVGEDLRDRLVELELKHRMDTEEIRQSTALLEGTMRMLRAKTVADALDAISATAIDVVDAQGVLILGHSCQGLLNVDSFDTECAVQNQKLGDLRFTLPKNKIDWFCRRRLVRDLREVPGFNMLARRAGAPRSVLSVPMACGGGGDGALVLLHGEVGHFSLEDQSLLRTLAIYAENALKSIRTGQRARLLSQVLDGSTSSQMLIEPHAQGGRILYVNKAFTRMTGREATEICGKTFLADRPTASDAQGKLREAYRKGDSGTFVIQNPNAKGQPFDNEIALTRIEDEKGNLQFMLATHADVTEQLAYERHQRELEEKMREFQKNESIGRLAAGVAHDFNNLLAVISGSADLLGSVPDADAKLVGECAQRINLAATRASKMINRFLDLGNPSSSFATVDVGSILAESRDLLESTISKNVILRQSLGDEIIPVTCNQSDILRMVLNLVQNAQDALPVDGGEIAQTLYRVNGMSIANDKMAVGSIDAAQNYCCYQIKDNGTGIDRKTLARLFQDSVSTKGARGSGLGMLVVAEIVRNHSGALAIETKAGKGTTIRVYLPCDDTVVPKGTQADVGAVRLDGKLILLVDDDTEVSSVIGTYLERLGAEVAICDDPQIALEVLEEDSESFSMMLTDYSMPGLNGGRLADVAHCVDPELPIVVITALARKITDPMLSADHVLALLPKPVDLTALSRLVAEKSRVTD